MAEPFSQWFTAVRNSNYELVTDMIGQYTCQRDLHGQTALMIAAISDDEKMVNLLLPHEAGMLDPQGRTALMLAALASSPGSAQLLAEKEKGILFIDGRNAMMMAASYGSHSVVLALLPFFTYERDKAGYTALDHASIGGHLETVKILVQHLDFSVDDLSRARDSAYKNSFTQIGDFLALSIEERLGARNSTMTMSPNVLGSASCDSAGWRCRLSQSHQNSDSSQLSSSTMYKMKQPSTIDDRESYTLMLQELVQEYETQILRQNKLLDQLTSKVIEKDREIAHWQNMLSAMESSTALADLEAESATKKDPMDDINVLQATIKVKASNIERLQRKLDDETFQHQILKAENADLKENYQRLTNNLERLQAEIHSRDTSGLNARNVLYLQEKLNELEAELADARLIMTKFLDDNSYLVGDTDLQGDETIEELLSLEVRILKHKYIQQHLRHGRAIQRLRDMCERLHGKLSEKERALNKERTALKQEKLSNDRTMLLDMIDEQSAKIKKLQTSLSTYRSSSPDRRDGTVGEDTAKLLSEVMHLKDVIAQKDEQMLSLLNKLEGKSNLQIVTETYDVDKNQEDEITISRLRDELNNARATIAKLRANAYKEKTATPSASVLNSPQTSAYTPKQRSCSQLSRDCKVHTGYKTTPHRTPVKNIRELTDQLAEKDQMIETLKKELEESEKAYSSEQKSIYEQVSVIAQKLADATATSKDMIQMSHTDFIDLKNLIYTQQKKLSLKDAELLAAKSANKRLLDDLAKERAATISRVNSKISSLEHENRDLQRDISRAHITAESCRTNLQQGFKGASSLNPEYALSPPPEMKARSRDQTTSISESGPYYLSNMNTSSPKNSASYSHNSPQPSSLKYEEKSLVDNMAPSYSVPGSDDVIGQSY